MYVRDNNLTYLSKKMTYVRLVLQFDGIIV